MLDWKPEDIDLEKALHIFSLHHEGAKVTQAIVKQRYEAFSGWIEKLLLEINAKTPFAPGEMERTRKTVIQNLDAAKTQILNALERGWWSILFKNHSTEMADVMWGKVSPHQSDYNIWKPYSITDEGPLWQALMDLVKESAEKLRRQAHPWQPLPQRPDWVYTAEDALIYRNFRSDLWENVEEDYKIRNQFWLGNMNQIPVDMRKEYIRSNVKGDNAVTRTSVGWPSMQQIFIGILFVIALFGWCHALSSILSSKVAEDNKEYLSKGSDVNGLEYANVCRKLYNGYLEEWFVDMEWRVLNRWNGIQLGKKKRWIKKVDETTIRITFRPHKWEEYETIFNGSEEGQYLLRNEIAYEDLVHLLEKLPKKSY